MKVVLLSGGSGTRLWPVSTENCPKQFLSIFNDNESMLLNTYKAIKKNYSSIYFATQNKYVDLIKEQIHKKVNCIIEPEKIGTFGAILNIANYFKYVEELNDDEIISVIPTDHDVNADFYKILEEGASYLKNNSSNICLVGIKPTHPSIQFGYILHSNNQVLKFMEKPDLEKARELINKKALWNSGIVIFKLKYIIDITKQYIQYKTYEEFVNMFIHLPKNSFDKQVLEKVNDIAIVESSNCWNDLGTWENLSQKITVPDIYNTNIINFENKNIKNKGVKDSIIVNSQDGILLVNKNIEQVFWRQWGNFKVIENFFASENNIKIKILNILKDKNISYQFHKYRNEVWFILDGNGEVILDNKSFKVNAGDVIQIPKEKLHSIKALEDVQIIEVQYGQKNVEEDIIRIETNWYKIKELINKKN